mmetsp:Transcript_30413/g.90757  ORF Transcript_30413/g.90757 Transcript_30413/m.90757 type:complete len:233 (-) Transcript_30413:784-1482(-)
MRRDHRRERRGEERTDARYSGIHRSQRYHHSAGLPMHHLHQGLVDQLLHDVLGVGTRRRCRTGSLRILLRPGGIVLLRRRISSPRPHRLLQQFPLDAARHTGEDIAAVGGNGTTSPEIVRRGTQPGGRHRDHGGVLLPPASRLGNLPPHHGGVDRRRSARGPTIDEELRGRTDERIAPPRQGRVLPHREGSRRGPVAPARNVGLSASGQIGVHHRRGGIDHQSEIEGRRSRH